MKKIVICVLSAFLLGFLAFIFVPAQKPKFEQLVSQLEGGACNYCADNAQQLFWFRREPNKKIPLCRRDSMLGFWGPLLRRSHQENCVMDAAVCLAGMDEQSKALPYLIDALRKTQDVYTGDGTVPVKQTMALVLGLIGDKRAMAPLIETLKTNTPVRISGGATGYEHVDKKEFYHSYQDAVILALGMFGQDAKESVPLIVPFLKSEIEGMRHQRFLPCAAAYALGEIQDPSAIPELIAVSGYSECANVVEEALEKFGPHARAALPALSKLRDSRPPDSPGHSRMLSLDVKSAIIEIEK